MLLCLTNAQQQKQRVKQYSQSQPTITLLQLTPAEADTLQEYTRAVDVGYSEEARSHDTDQIESGELVAS